MLFTSARWDIDMKSDPRASAAEKQILIGPDDEPVFASLEDHPIGADAETIKSFTASFRF